MKEKIQKGDNEDLQYRLERGAYRDPSYVDNRRLVRCCMDRLDGNSTGTVIPFAKQKKRRRNLEIQNGANHYCANCADFGNWRR